jgi:hypothetical protein
MIIVGDVIVVNETADEVILKARFLMLISAEAQGFLFVRAQMLDKQVSIHGLIVDARRIQRK